MVGSKEILISFAVIVPCEYRLSVTVGIVVFGVLMRIPDDKMKQWNS